MKTNTETPISSLRTFSRLYEQVKIILAWQEITPEADATELIEEFISRGVSIREIQNLTHNISEMSFDDKAFLSTMISRGFKPEHVQIFVNSDARDRMELAKAWKISPSTLREKLSLAGPAVQGALDLGFAAGALGALAFAALGLALQSDDLVQTAKVLTDILPGPTTVVEQGPLINFTQSVSHMAHVSGGVSLISLFLKGAPSIIEALLRENIEDVIKETEQQLEDKVRGLFSRLGESDYPMPGKRINLSQALEELKVIPSDYLPLITHLKPRELAAFLTSDGDVRASMISKHPPKPEQRILVGRALNPGRFMGAIGAARQSLSTWEGRCADSKAVNLPSFISALQSARARKSESLPSASPPVLALHGL
jgi:hypothetical protein